MSARKAHPIRALIVSGKGGTGKSTIAMALAVAAVRRGRSTLLLDLEGRASFPEWLGVPNASFEERPTRLGFAVASVGPREALMEYLRRFYGMARLAGPVLRSRAADVVTEAAPGFRDLMLAGKLYETGEWRRSSPRARGLPVYDLVVADAPPTGQITSFLQAPRTWAEMIRVGRPGRQASSIDRFLRRHARVVLVTTPEELPVAETLEAIAQLEATGVGMAPVVVNRVLSPAVPARSGRALAALTSERLAALAGIGRGVAAAALDVVDHHRSEERAQRAQMRRLRDVPTLSVPMLLTAQLGPEELDVLVERVGELVP